MVCDILLIVEFESKIQLVLIVASLVGAAYALIMGNLWPAVACAISVFCLSVSYRSARQRERAELSTKEESRANG